MSKSKIEWTDYTWNPVWGCKANCDYCYARSIARRFAKPMSEKNMEYGTEMEALQIEADLRAFKPTFMFGNYIDFIFPKKPSRIFIGSMSDIVFWEDEWIEKVIDKIKQYPQHTFLLLTKFPKIYKILDGIMPENVWFGLTVTNKKDLEKMPLMIQIDDPVKRKLFTSFEPVLEHIPTRVIFGAGLTDWVIVGAMSGNNRKKTKTEWIGSIVADAKKYNKPVFVKQLEINGKVEKDISKFPKHLQLREFPKLKQS